MKKIMSLAVLALSSVAFANEGANTTAAPVSAPAAVQSNTTQSSSVVVKKSKKKKEKQVKKEAAPVEGADKSAAPSEHGAETPAH